ncbi:MAG TPA: amino acid adenylation domain-containing protein, partial [Blastocatellia bacterium]|nr:amino acid adenylation domain-containing protein [Blastocatellia bacterium]
TSFALVANFDLSPLTAEITLDLAYDRTELPLEQVQAIAGHYERALASMVSDPLASYGHVDLLSNAEKSHILGYSGAPAAAPTGSVISMFEDCVRHTPGAQAVVCGESAVSYEQLNRRANQLARRLWRHGVGPDVRVALFLDRSIEMIVAIFAVLKAGAAYLPIEPDHSDDRVNAILSDSHPGAILTTKAYVSRIGALSRPVIAIDWDDSSLSEEPDWNLDDLTTPDNLAYVIYTSGSTGHPKGVLISRNNLLHSTEARLQWYDAPAGRFLLLSPYSFDSSVAGIFWALCSGGTLVLTPGELYKDPAAIADLMHAQEVTTLLAVPALYANLLESCADRTLPPWRMAIVAGQACPVEVVRDHHRLFPSVALYNEYGPTETTVWSTAERCSPADDIVPIGKPVPYARAYVLDRQSAAAPIGTPGELFIGGVGVGRGYLGLADLTAERFLPDPFSSQQGARMYRTGDRARFRPDGRIEYLGRADWQIKIRGHRIEPEEVEAAIRSVTGVRDAAVAAFQHAAGDARLIGYIVFDGQQPPSVEFIRAELDRQLPAYMVPSLFVFLDSLPTGPNGKLDRRRLPAPVDAQRATAEFVAPRNEMEQTLADIWTAILQAPRVGIRDDFFGLGGDSIMSIQIIARAKQAGINITPIQLFQARTIENLAGLIRPSASVQTNYFLDGQPTAEDLRSEATLEADIYPESEWAQEKFELNNIFLTDATGFRGAFLLDALLRHTRSEIFCLVPRNGDEDEARRIKEILESFGLWAENYESRIIPVPGDLSKPLFGLSPERFRSLAAEIDAIYHNGAVANYIYPYSAHKPVNVQGTREALRLACQVKAKPIHYVSTLSIFSLIGDASVKLEEEEPEPPATQPTLNMGYSQSRWVAERLVIAAKSRGLPVSIYRTGRIIGHSRSGVSNLEEFACRFMKGCIQLGSIPDWEGEVNAITVDYVSEAIAQLSLQKESPGKIFHLVNPESARWNRIIEWIESYGYPLSRVPYNKWREGVKLSPENALHVLLPIFPRDGFEKGMVPPEVSTQGKVEFDCLNTLRGLANASVVCRPITSALINSYLSYFVDSGFLPAPTRRATS